MRRFIVPLFVILTFILAACGGGGTTEPLMQRFSMSSRQRGSMRASMTRNC